MRLTEQIFTHALLLVRDCESDQQQLLRTLCQASEQSLRAKLQEGLTPEDCLADFVAAASLFALSAMNSVEDVASVSEFKAGDLTVKTNGVARDAASRCLQHQAELVIAPYLKDNFAFLGV